MGLVRLTGPMDQPAIGTGTCMINLERAGPGLDYAKERAMGLTCPLSFEPHHNFNHSTPAHTCWYMPTMQFKRAGGSTTLAAQPPTKKKMKFVLPSQRKTTGVQDMTIVCYGETAHTMQVYTAKRDALYVYRYSCMQYQYIRTHGVDVRMH